MSVTRFPNGISSFGVPVIGSGPIFTTGSIFFVHSGTGSDGNTGDGPDKPFATIDYAIGRCTADKGDHIIVMPGHAETLSTAITCDIADVTIIGLGNGTNRPALTGAIVGDAISITATDVTWKNFYFPASTAAVTSRFNVAAANCTISDCVFQCGANDLESITLPATATECHIEGCQFIVSANGPDAAIEIEATGVVGLIVRNCIFDGMNDTNAWDQAAINSGVAHLRCLIDNNLFYEGEAITFTAAATGLITRNLSGGGTLYVTIDPGSCFSALNYGADAIDEYAAEAPQTEAV